MIPLTFANSKKKIAIISGSPRNENSCSGGKSKTSKIVSHIINDGPEADYILYDLTVIDDEPRVQPCKGCISTANGFQCHFPCSCYSLKDDVKDYMYEKDVYNGLMSADIILTFTPIHWYTVTSVIKSFFDRLVCINLTLPVEKAKELFGDDIKNSKLTTKHELSGKYKNDLKNHYAGKIFGVFAHGDEGANDYTEATKPASLKVDNKEASFNQLIGLLPLAFQMRYGGLIVPDDLVEYHKFGKNIPYAKNNATFESRHWILDKATDFVKRAIQHQENQQAKSKEETDKSVK